MPTRPTRSSRLNPAQVRLKLLEVAERLRAAQSCVAVAVTALRAQSADVDEDVARLLVRSVADPLQDQIDTIYSLRRSLAPPVRRKR